MSLWHSKMFHWMHFFSSGTIYVSYAHTGWKRASGKIAHCTKVFHRRQPTNCLSLFNHFFGLTLKRFWIWSHLLKKSLTKNLIFSAVVRLGREGRFIVLKTPSLHIHIAVKNCSWNIDTCFNYATKLLEYFFFFFLLIKCIKFSLVFLCHKTVTCSHGSL